MAVLVSFSFISERINKKTTADTTCSFTIHGQSIEDLGYMKFCFSKEIDALEFSIDSDEIRQKDVYQLFALIDNPACSKEQKAKVNRILFKVMNKQIVQFLTIYERAAKKVQHKVNVEIMNPKCSDCKFEDAIHLLSGISNNELQPIRDQLLKKIQAENNSSAIN